MLGSVSVAPSAASPRDASRCGKAEPWPASDWPYLRPTAYLFLMRRLMIGPDIASGRSRLICPRAYVEVALARRGSER